MNSLCNFVIYKYLQRQHDGDDLIDKLS